MKREIKVYVEDILESIEKIEEYTKPISEEIFYKNIQVQDAVLRRLEIVGEADFQPAANFSLRGFLIMESKIDINLIIWLVFLLLLFGSSLIKWLIRRFSKGSVLGQGEGEGREEAAPQEGRGPLLHRTPPFLK